MLVESGIGPALFTVCCSSYATGKPNYCQEPKQGQIRHQCCRVKAFVLIGSQTRSVTSSTKRCSVFKSQLRSVNLSLYTEYLYCSIKFFSIIAVMSASISQLNAISEESEFESLLKTTDGKPLVLLFTAKWFEECSGIEHCLARFGQRDRFVMAKVEVDDSSALPPRFSVSQIPTVVFIVNGEEVDRVEGFKTVDILNKLKFHAKLYIPGFDNSDNMETRLRNLISMSKVMVFMKGTKQQPLCKFSRALVEILNNTGVSYETFNVLEDNDVREGLKKFSNWPTYPQVYVDGSLVGGLDIIRELDESKELLSTLRGNETTNE
uniref:Glutaredoxin domain-containing protein n=2 Tax=Trichuris muris TaxID=70415 RepID=A0A5S6Q4S7_TRIMR